MTAGLLEARPRLRRDAVIGTAQQRGPARVHRVRVAGSRPGQTGRSLEVGPKERFVLVRLDGTHTLGQIAEAYQHEFGRALGPAHWGQILGTLAGRGMLELPGGVLPVLPDVPAPAVARSGIVGRPVAVLGDPTPLLARLVRGLRPALTAYAVVPLTLAVTAMVVMLGSRLEALAEQTGAVMHRPGALLLVAGASWLAAALHELAHGVAAQAAGVPVRELGIRWLPPLVLPYCRTDDYLYLPRRRTQVGIALAGVLVELGLLLPVAAVWWWGSPSPGVRDVLAALLLLGGGHALLNLVPVPPTDGYQMLGQALGLPDLGRQSAAYVVLAARHDPRRHTYPRWTRAVYLVYAAALLVSASFLAGVLWALLEVWLGGPVAASLVTAGLLLLAATPVLLAVVRRRLAPTGGRHRAGSRAPVVDERPRPVVEGPPRPSVEEGSPRARRETTRPEQGPALQLRGVVKSYAGRNVVDGVDLVVGRGEFVGLLGPNGAGKSTLVEIAAGLREADAGEVSVLGSSPWPRDRALLARIGVQTQHAAFFVRLTAVEHLRTVAALRGRDHRAAAEALDLVGLTASARTRADRLSGGQQQRLAIATALLHDPELVFLDEPTASLDPQARRELWGVLRRLHASGRTVVYTTHHLDEAEALCDRVAILAAGRVVAQGTPYALVADAALPTRLLLPRAAVPDGLDADVVARLAGVLTARLDGPALVVETCDEDRVRDGLRALGVSGLQSRVPTLEDVYLHLLGTESPR